MNFKTKENMGTTNYPAPTIDKQMQLASCLLDEFPDTSVTSMMGDVASLLSKKEGDSYYIMRNLYVGYKALATKLQQQAEKKGLEGNDLGIIRLNIKNIAYNSLCIVRDVVKVLHESGLAFAQKDFDRIYDAIKYTPESISHSMMFTGKRFLDKNLDYTTLPSTFVENEDKRYAGAYLLSKNIIVEKLLGKRQQDVTAEDRKKVFERPKTEREKKIRQVAEQKDFAELMSYLNKKGVTRI